MRIDPKPTPRGSSGLPEARRGRRRTGRHRDRRGRGLRSPLLPQGVPAHNSRSDEFDAVALEAFAEIDAQWHDQIAGLDIAVDEIPRISPKDPESVQWPPEVVADGPIALARLIPAGVDVRGNSTRARIVLFRKPIERRAKDTDELAELLHEVLVAQVATYLGVEPSVIDPTLDEGVYCQFRGPQYETPAEVRMAKALGGDLVGMSTALDAIAGVQVFEANRSIIRTLKADGRLLREALARVDAPENY